MVTYHGIGSWGWQPLELPVFCTQTNAGTLVADGEKKNTRFVGVTDHWV